MDETNNSSMVGECEVKNKSCNSCPYFMECYHG